LNEQGGWDVRSSPCFLLCMIPTLEIVDTDDPFTITIIDTSNYTEEPGFTSLSVTLPGFSCDVDVDINVGCTTVLTAEDLGFEEGLKLPDGLYKLEYIVDDNAPTITYILKTVQLNEAVANILLNVDLEDKALASDLEKTLSRVFLLKEAAKQRATCELIQDAQKIYNTALRLLHPFQHGKK